MLFRILSAVLLFTTTFNGYSQSPTRAKSAQSPAPVVPVSNQRVLQTTPPIKKLTTSTKEVSKKKRKPSPVTTAPSPGSQAAPNK